MTGRPRRDRDALLELQRQLDADSRYHRDAMAAVLAERDTYKEKLRAALALLQEMRALKPPTESGG